MALPRASVGPEYKETPWHESCSSVKCHSCLQRSHPYVLQLPGTAQAQRGVRNSRVWDARVEPNNQVAGIVFVNIWTKLALETPRAVGDASEGGGGWPNPDPVVEHKGCSDSGDVAVPKDSTIFGCVYVYIYTYALYSLLHLLSSLYCKSLSFPDLSEGLLEPGAIWGYLQY